MSNLLEQSGRESEIEITSPDQWVAFMDAKKSYLRKKPVKFSQLGHQSLCVLRILTPRILHKFVDFWTFALGGLERSGAEDVAKHQGAQMIDHIDDLDHGSLGHFLKR